MTKRNISYNRTAIVNRSGEVSSLTISRAITIGALTENITPMILEENEDYRPDNFFVIPTSEGEIKVVLANSLGEEYLITEAEVSANLGVPIPYLIKEVIMDGTTAELNIGW